MKNFLLILIIVLLSLICIKLYYPNKNIENDNNEVPKINNEENIIEYGSLKDAEIETKLVKCENGNLQINVYVKNNTNKILKIKPFKIILTKLDGTALILAGYIGEELKTNEKREFNASVNWDSNECKYKSIEYIKEQD